MNTLTKGFCLAVVFIMLCSAIRSAQAANQPGNIASDFEEALEMAPKRARWRSGIMYYDMEDAANSFVSKYSDNSALEFLEEQIENDPGSRKLALLSTGH